MLTTCTTYTKEDGYVDVTMFTEIGGEGSKINYMKRGSTYLSRCVLPHDYQTQVKANALLKLCKYIPNDKINVHFMIIFAQGIESLYEIYKPACLDFSKWYNVLTRNAYFCMHLDYLKLKFRQYPGIHTNYSLSNCTISNYSDLSRSSEFLGIN